MGYAVMEKRAGWGTEYADGFRTRPVADLQANRKQTISELAGWSNAAHVTDLKPLRSRFGRRTCGYKVGEKPLSVVALFEIRRSRWKSLPLRNLKTVPIQHGHFPARLDLFQKAVSQQEPEIQVILNKLRKETITAMEQQDKSQPTTPDDWFSPPTPQPPTPTEVEVERVDVEPPPRTEVEVERVDVEPPPQ